LLLDASRIAVSISEGGSEDGSLHIFDVATGTDIAEVIPRVQYPTGGGSLAWASDGKGFYYTRYPGPERPADSSIFPSAFISTSLVPTRRTTSSSPGAISPRSLRSSLTIVRTVSWSWLRWRTAMAARPIT
jgi:Prolyl oligopeptidase, N-terminal beta-propeller domain